MKNNKQSENFLIQLKSITDDVRYILHDMNALVVRAETTKKQVADIRLYNQIDRILLRTTKQEKLSQENRNTQLEKQLDNNNCKE